MKIALFCEHSDSLEKAKSYSEKFKIPLIDNLDLNLNASSNLEAKSYPSNLQPDFLLAMTSEGLELRDLKNPKLTPLKISPEIGALGYRIKKGGQDLLLKAIGKGETILDLTAGLGKDLFLLRAHKYKVTGIEKNAALAMLLMDAADRIKNNDINEKLNSGDIKSSSQVIHGNSLEVIDDLGEFDIIYMDPMFFGQTGQKRRSLPKKDMQIVERLLEQDMKVQGEASNSAGEHVDNSDDYVLLLQKARVKARKVVVKRHIKNEPLAKDVSISFKGDTVRFDVYVRAN
jgi:16S rRNA (guanine1516-N2)-methyltransferase